jgi:hypothetical protein
MGVITVHIWPSEQGTFWFWDTAEDSGGFGYTVPTGPFTSRQLCIKDAREVFLDIGQPITLLEGKPARYLAKSLFKGGL